MQALLTGKRRFVEFHDTDLSPKRLGDIADIDARSLSDKTDPNYTFKYISLSDVKQGAISSSLETFKFSEAPVRARKLVKDNDILMSTVRPNLQGFGIIRSNAHQYVVSTGFAVISVKQGYSPDYVFQCLFSDHMTAQLNALVVGSNYPAINSTDVRNLLIYCPLYEEQRRIAAVLAACDREIELIQCKRDLLRQQKQGLMQQLLTGQRRV
jgi:type I restriction enzyme S subunit